MPRVALLVILLASATGAWALPGPVEGSGSSFSGSPPAGQVDRPGQVAEEPDTVPAPLSGDGQVVPKAERVEDEGADDGWGDESTDDGWGDEWDDGWDEPGGSNWSGFLESGLGYRIKTNPPLDRSGTLREVRAQLKNEWRLGSSTVSLTIDGLYDGILSEWRLDPRELALAASPGSTIDLKIGRQVLTWGTGDLLFLNDLFPKDFQSFFAGRDEEYLKAPSDAIRASWFGKVANLDVVWSPLFEPDRQLTGERFSFFVPQLGERAAPDQGRVPGPDDFPSDGEVSVRLFRTVSGVEWAGYGYRGMFKSPLGLDEAGRPTYPRLDVYGGSARWPAWQGLANVELAWYRSADDRTGDRPGIPNDQLRLLVGFEREIVSRLTLGIQGYLEHTRDHERLLAASPWPAFEPRENRTVATVRLTHRAFRDQLVSSLFVFLSPSDDDWHLRPRIDWRYSDAWNFTAGANLFGGDEPHTFFSQLDGNDNVYLRARFNF